MKPSRQYQPHRRGARTPSAALFAMLKGRTAGGYNPADARRAAALVAAGGRAKRRPRPKRPARAPR